MTEYRSCHATVSMNPVVLTVCIPANGVDDFKEVTKFCIAQHMLFFNLSANYLIDCDKSIFVVQSE